MKIDQDECPICLECLSNNIHNLPCGHGFHSNCISQYIVSCKSIDVACPICRTKIPNVLDIITPIYTPCPDVRITITNVNTGLGTNIATSDIHSMSSEDSSDEEERGTDHEPSCCKVIATMFMHVVMPVSLFIVLTHILFPM